MATTFITSLPYWDQTGAMLPDVLFFRQIWLFFVWLAGKIRFWRVADFLAIFEIFWLKIWWIFVQDLLHQCLLHTKVVKIDLI